jgi:hypothetical protein
LRIHEDVKSDRFLAAVRLRHASNADEITDLDVGERRLDHGGDPGFVCQFNGERLSVARLDRQILTVDLFDRPAHAHGRRRLRGGKWRGHEQSEGARAQHPACHCRHAVLPNCLAGGIECRRSL